MIILLLLKMILILMCIAYFTMQESKLMAAMQSSKGPNVVGFFGLAQPLADGFKLLLKEMVVPMKSSKSVFIASPLLIICLSLAGWIFMPGNLVFDNLSHLPWDLYATNLLEVCNVNFYKITNTQNLTMSLTDYSLLFILAFSSMNVYGMMAAGWSSYSKYAFLGALSSSAQMISYEISMGLLLLPIVSLTNSFNFTELIFAQIVFGWNCFMFLPLAVLFAISILAETNRTPFDLPEAEAELVAGYNVEYSSIMFAMFFLGEYSNMLLMSVTFMMLFFGGWNMYFENFGACFQAAAFAMKTSILCFYFILVSALLPRYKYNQLLYIGWKLFLPLSVAFLCLTSLFLSKL